MNEFRFCSLFFLVGNQSYWVFTEFCLLGRAALKSDSIGVAFSSSDFLVDGSSLYRVFTEFFFCLISLAPFSIFFLKSVSYIPGFLRKAHNFE